MKSALFLAMAWSLLVPLSVHSRPFQVEYSTRADEEGGRTLVARVGQTPLNGPTDGVVVIEKTVDLDHDGTLDALFVMSCGGNGCPEIWSVATISSGALRVHELGASPQTPTIRDEGAYSVIELVGDEDVTGYVLSHGELAVYSRQGRLKLEAIRQIEGAGHSYAEPGTRTLRVDVDGDGKDEIVACEIWPRWGSLMCSLPRGRGEPQRLDLGCDRFGALPTFSHGMREFVCNRDTVIRFDGHSWKPWSSAVR